MLKIKEYERFLNSDKFSSIKHSYLSTKTILDFVKNNCFYKNDINDYIQIAHSFILKQNKWMNRLTFIIKIRLLLLSDEYIRPVLTYEEQIAFTELLLFFISFLTYPLQIHIAIIISLIKENWSVLSLIFIFEESVNDSLCL